MGKQEKICFRIAKGNCTSLRRSTNTILYTDIRMQLLTTIICASNFSRHFKPKMLPKWPLFTI